MVTEERKKKEKETPMKCVCGKMPVSVKCRGKHMYSCPDTMSCSARGRWCSTEQLAAKDWNITLQGMLYERVVAVDNG